LAAQLGLFAVRGNCHTVTAEGRRILETNP
jgi:hypothetical protein